MSKPANPFERAALKHKIFKRDGFRCLYCEQSPDDDGWLEMDHLIPRSHRGSDHLANLVTSCNLCNRDKGSKIRIPTSMCESAAPDRDGFLTWKSWGGWSLEFNEEAAMLHFKERGYFIDLDRVHENDWEEHMLHKTWCRAERVTFPCRREHEPLRSAWGRDPLFMNFLEFSEEVDRQIARNYEEPDEDDRLHQPAMRGSEIAESLCRKIERDSHRYLPIVGNQNHNDLIRALAFCRLIVRAPKKKATAVVEDLQEDLQDEAQDDTRRNLLESANGRSFGAENPGACCWRCGYPTGSDALGEIDEECPFDHSEVRHVDREQCARWAAENGAPT